LPRSNPTGAIVVGAAGVLFWAMQVNFCYWHMPKNSYPKLPPAGRKVQITTPVFLNTLQTGLIYFVDK
jgi:hypothetical protein